MKGRHLVLWRHAEAAPGIPDRARALTELGHQQAAAMGKWLKKRLPSDVRVVSSPAVRAYETAAHYGTDYEIDERLAPGATADQVLTAVAWPSAGAVIAVGHQPTFGEIVSQLLHRPDPNFSIRKGAIVWFVERIRDGRNEIVLRAVISPDML